MNHRLEEDLTSVCSPGLKEQYLHGVTQPYTKMPAVSLNSFR